MTSVVGADLTRTPRGIIAVTLQGGHLHEVRLHGDLAAFLDASRDADAVVVDLPIGHDDPDGTKRNGRRRADLEARAFVGPRAADLPEVAPFLVLLAPTHEAAVAEARAHEWPVPTAAQWAVRERILRLQEHVRHHPNLHEGRPAASFQAMHTAKGRTDHLQHPPHYWSGLHERLTLLHAENLRPTRSFGGIGRMNPEDVVAATALAWTAARIAAGQAQAFPQYGDVRLMA